MDCGCGSAHHALRGAAGSGVLDHGLVRGVLDVAMEPARAAEWQCGPNRLAGGADGSWSAREDTGVGVWEGRAVKLSGRALRLSIFVGEGDIWHHKSLYAEIVHRAHKAGLAGATVIKGIEGWERCGAR